MDMKMASKDMMCFFFHLINSSGKIWQDFKNNKCEMGALDLEFWADKEIIDEQGNFSFTSMKYLSHGSTYEHHIDLHFSRAFLLVRRDTLLIKVILYFCISLESLLSFIDFLKGNIK